MGEKEKKVIELENKQKELKKTKRKLQKTIPYFIATFIFLTIAAIYLTENKVNSIFGNTTNLILFWLSGLGIVSLIYLILIVLKTKKLDAENLQLGNQIYDLMKLKKTSEEA